MLLQNNYLFVLILLIILAFAEGIFDVDEIHSVNYGIDILNEPVMLGEAADGAVFLTSKYGQQYQCSYTEKNADEQREREEEKVAMETGITELLNDMENRPCLTNTKGWWTYEFCFRKYIKQYHVEDGQISGNVLYLGQYSSDYDWSNTTNLRKQRSWITRYHTQQYINGSNCDLTGKPRRTEVKFYCEQTEADYISRVDETETCVYTITVQTPRLCHHPYLKPPKPNKGVPITCNPLLAEQDYNEYQLIKEEKRIEELAAQRKKRMPVSNIESDLKQSAWDGEDDLDSDDGADSDNLLLPSSGSLEKLISDSLIHSLKEVFGDDEGNGVKVSKIRTQTLKKSQDLTKLIQDTLSSSSKAQTKSQTLDQKTSEKGITHSLDEEESLLKEKKALQDEIEALIDENEALEDENEALQDANVASIDEDDDGFIEDENDAEILADFEKGLEELDMSDESMAQLHEYKEALKSEMNAQFGDIIKEAKEELKDLGIDEADIDKEETMKTMSATLDKLLKQLNKKKTAGKADSGESMDESTIVTSSDTDDDHVADVAADSDSDVAADSDADDIVEDSDADDDLINMEYDLEYGDSDPDPNLMSNDLLDSSEESRQTSDTVSPSHNAQSNTDIQNNEELEPVYRTEIFNEGGAKIKVTTKTYKEKSPVSSEDEESTETRENQSGAQEKEKSSEVKDLKEVVLSKLQKTGINTQDHKIQVKIFTSADYYEDVTGEMLQDAGGKLKKMMVAVLGANTEEIQEQQRQEQMQQNYGFVWKSKSSSSHSSGEYQVIDTEENDSEH